MQNTLTKQTIETPLIELDFSLDRVQVNYVNEAWKTYVTSHAETSRFLAAPPFIDPLLGCIKSDISMARIGTYGAYELLCFPLATNRAVVLASQTDSASQPYHEHIIENMLLTAYVIEPGSPHKVLYCNRYIETLTGYIPKQFINTQFYTTHIHPSDVDRVLTEVDHATQNKQSFEFTYRFQRADGHWIWVYERGQAIFNAKGEIQYYIGTIMDVSEGKAVRNILKRQKQLLDAILKATRTILEAEDVDAVLNDCFEWLGAALNIGRIYFYKNASRQGKLYTNLTHEWAASNVTPVIDDPDQQNIPIDAMPEFFEPLLNGKPFEHIVQDISDETLRKHLEAQQIRSLLVFPVLVHEQFYGFVGFDEVEECRSFSALEHDYLGSFARSLATALTRKADAASIASQNQLFQTIFEAIDSGMAVFDNALRVLHVNEAMRPFMIRDFEPGATCTSLFKDDRVVCENCPVKQAFDLKQTTVSYRKLKHNNKLVDVEIKAYPILDDRMRVRQVVQVIRNISEQKAYESNLKMLSETDYLTGVYNRAYFERKLEAFDELKQEGYAIMSLDIDGLKLINETLGSHVGDQILKSLGSVLKTYGDEKSYVGRMGGDEFAVLYESAEQAQRVAHNIETLATQLYADLSSGLESIPQSVISFSIGVAKQEGDMSAFEVLRRSDNMMYSQKLRKGQSAKSTIVKTLIETLKARDVETERHGDRLHHYVSQLGRALKLSESDMVLLETLAEVHDIGKIGIPDAILLKPGKLTEQEWEIMRTHPEKGYRIASNSPDLLPVADLILKHHEHFDGSGYPFGLTGEEIPLLCRILAVCDAYDAMTSHRPYRAAMRQAEAIAELRRCRGSQFDPNVVDQFIDVLLNQQ